MSEFWPAPTAARPRGVRRRRGAPVLARGAAAARPRAARVGHRPRPTSASSAAGSPGCGRRCTPRPTTPAREVVVLEADTVGFGASGRNGGFVDRARSRTGWRTASPASPTRCRSLERLGAENFAGLAADLERHGIDCRLELTGDLVAILEPYQEAWIEEEVELLRRFGHDVEVFDGAGDARRGRLADLPRPGSGTGPAPACSTPARSPTACARRRTRLGVRIHERTPAEALEPRGDGVRRAHAAVAGSARAACCWPRARSRRSCARSAATSCRSTTTRS